MPVGEGIFPRLRPAAVVPRRGGDPVGGPAAFAEGHLGAVLTALDLADDIAAVGYIRIAPVRVGDPGELPAGIGKAGGAPRRILDGGQGGPAVGEGIHPPRAVRHRRDLFGAVIGHRLRVPVGVRNLIQPTVGVEMHLAVAFIGDGVILIGAAGIAFQGIPQPVLVQILGGVVGVFVKIVLRPVGVRQVIGVIRRQGAGGGRYLHAVVGMPRGGVVVIDILDGHRHGVAARGGDAAHHRQRAVIVVDIRRRIPPGGYRGVSPVGLQPLGVPVVDDELGIRVPYAVVVIAVVHIDLAAGRCGS